MGGVEHAYATVADRYIELFGRAGSVHADDLALIARHLTIDDGIVLDLGCGPGHLTAHLAARGVDVIGLDLTMAFVAHARRTHDLDRFACGSLSRIPIPAGSAAGILAWYSLIHLRPEEVDHVLVEFRRVAAPGARLVVGFFDGDEIARFPHRVTAAYTWPIDELSSRLREAGFIETERLCRPADPDTGTRSHAALVVAR